MKRFLGLLVLCVSVMAMPVYAGTWVQSEDAAWYYEEPEGFVTGWQEINEHWYYFNEDGSMLTGWLNDLDYDRWYYLDPQTGVWNSKPAINKVSACHLLENAVKAAGLYQNEDAELLYRVLEDTGSEIQVSVGIETAPDRFSPINTYTINKKTGIAKTTIGNNLYLYH